MHVRKEKGEAENPDNRVGKIFDFTHFMEKSNVSLENLLNQLSEEKINLVVDSDALRAAGGEVPPPCGGGSGSGSGGSGSSSGSGKSHKKSKKTKKHSGSFGGCW